MLHKRAKAANNADKGWAWVTLEGITKNGHQALVRRPPHIKKDTGDGNALDHYKSLRGQDKLEFDWKFKVDRGAAFMTATEHHGRDVTQSALRVEGWVKEAQVALEEGLQNYTSNLEHNQLLMDILEGLHSRPH